jgi:hypothetical protein
VQTLKSTIKTTVIALLGLVAGVVSGVAGTAYFLSSFQTNALNTRFIADATFQLAVIEKIQNGDTTAAIPMLTAALKGNMVALDASDSQLSHSQGEAKKSLLDRIEKSNALKPQRLAIRVQLHNEK